MSTKFFYASSPVFYLDLISAINSDVSGLHDYPWMMHPAGTGRRKNKDSER
jgi:hypothetical protein